MAELGQAYRRLANEIENCYERMKEQKAAKEISKFKRLGLQPRYPRKQQREVDMIDDLLDCVSKSISVVHAVGNKKLD